MRVCPKCGFVDPPYWRATFNRKVDEDYTNLSNLLMMFPADFIEELEVKKEIHKSPYDYRLTKFGNVIRRWEKLKDCSCRDYEKHRPRNPNQRKLIE